MTYMEVENHDDFYTFETDGRVIVSDSTGTNIIYDVAFDDLRYGSMHVCHMGFQALQRYLQI